MGEILTDITFERWVKYIFDHPVIEGQSYWHTDWSVEGDYWDESKSPATTISFMTQLFENAGTILAPYSDAQLSQSFWYLDSDGEGYMYTLREPSVPLEDRLRCIRSIYTLFEQVFAVRCSQPSPNTPSLEDQKKNPLDTLCYMWWDISPLYGAMEVDNLSLISEAVINVMKQTLELDSTVCQASALHGLGHWKLDFPQQIEHIIDTWLENHSNAADKVKKYALSARTGMIQ